MNPQSSIADIDDGIAFFQNTHSQFPRSHFIHTLGVHGLATARFLRYDLLEENEDLDKCILHFTEAILLPPLPMACPGLNTVELLFRLILALFRRSKKFEQLDDVQYAIEYLRYLRGLPLDSFDIPRNKVIELLIEALCFHVHLTEDATRNMEEVLALCRELLASDISTDFPAAAFSSLYPAIHTELFRGRRGPLLDEAIGFLRDAVKVCPPHLHKVHLCLAGTLSDRFATTHSRDDYEDAKALFEEVVNPNYSGENLDSEQLLALMGLLRLALGRATYFKKPEYFEETISHCRSMLDHASLPNEVRSLITGSLVVYARRRFKYHGLSEGLQDDTSSFDPELVRMVSSQGLAVFKDLSYYDAIRETYSKTAIEKKILDLREMLSNTRPWTQNHVKCLDHLAGWYKTKFSLTKDVMDIDESIKYRRLSLDAADSDDHLSSRPIHLVRLCTTLVFAFKGTNKIGYLDESIILCHDILRLKSAERMHFNTIRVLVSSLFSRLSLLNRIEDLNEVMRLIPLAADNRYAQAPERFQVSCIWAYLARRINHSSITVAYKKAMTLMQDSLSFSPTIQIQHDRLVAMDEYCKRMPFDYASYQVDLGQLGEAIETLEQGRALLWSEMRGLRTPIAEPTEEDLPLAKRLAEINQELETVTMSIAPSRRLETENGGSQSSDGMDAFGRLLIRQRKLLEERNALISQIQGRAGFEGFSKTPSFATLLSAASHGPVIIINHCEWRCDILILHGNAPPSLIPTPEDFFDRGNKLKDRLLYTRNDRGLDSSEYELTLGFVLSELYELVGKPVIQRLHRLGIPEQSRIWCCPTSAFCSLPLHAMGPIPSTDGAEVKPQYISDLYICSYTPTLSALIDSRRRDSPHPSRNSSLLLVAQLDASLPDAQTEIKVIQALSVQVTSLVSEDATSSAVVDGLRDHRLVHFACHGTLERARPFDASFELHGGDRLTLLEIVRSSSRLPSAEFAFLAACHTAELTQDSVSDEGLHLVAAMQYCGFRSAVGTMWAMADIDGPDLAKHFYRSLFARKKTGIPYYERSAEALRDAVQRLRRKKKISLERWVNFVHYGA